ARAGEERRDLLAPQFDRRALVGHEIRFEHAVRIAVERDRAQPLRLGATADVEVGARAQQRSPCCSVFFVIEPSSFWVGRPGLWSQTRARPLWGLRVGPRGLAAAGAVAAGHASP